MRSPSDPILKTGPTRPPPRSGVLGMDLISFFRGGGEEDGVLVVPEDHNTEEGHRAARWVVCSDSAHLGTQPCCGGYS